jgi:UDP-N-acetyl-D-glucosamine dehydrogenase
MHSVELTAANLKKYDLVVLSTDHDAFDYKFICENAKLIVDTRNAFSKACGIRKNVIKA